MIRLHVDKIASATKNVPIKKEVRVTPQVTGEEGYIIAGRIRGQKSVYNTLENCQGRMVPLHDGDIIVGVLGHRNALHGYSGVVPERVTQGDTLHLLNLGGVIGQCTSINPEVGSPFEVEVLGSVLMFPEFENRTGIPAHVSMNSLARAVSLENIRSVPIIWVAGTCMNAGKTLASCQVIRFLDSQGLKVAACKLTGVSLLRDVLNMQDYGAKWTASFVDAGIVTTSAETSADTAVTVIAHLSQTDSEVIVAELGDGLLGEYGVGAILAQKELMKRTGLLVLCANDPVGAWGGVRILNEEYGVTADIITGPTTDNDVGTKFIEKSLGISAVNARLKGNAFGAMAFEKLKEKGL